MARWLNVRMSLSDPEGEANEGLPEMSDVEMFTEVRAALFEGVTFEGPQGQLFGVRAMELYEYDSDGPRGNRLA